jgi:hypothetical protein
MENHSKEKHRDLQSGALRFSLMILFISSVSFAATNTITTLTQLTLDPSRTSNAIQTNVSFFTENFYQVPPAGMDYPEVQALFQKDVFKDVFEKDTESALRRFEVEFAISLPAVLLLNQLILRLVATAETGSFYATFSTPRNIYWYASTILISGAIAWQDYVDQKRKRDATGLRWNLFEKRF